MNPSFLFVITPAAKLSEAALAKLEETIRVDLGGIQVFQRNVQNTLNSFYRGSDADGKPQFLWLMQLELVSSGTGGSAIGEALQTAKKALKRRAKISAAFTLSDLSG